MPSSVIRAMRYFPEQRTVVVLFRARGVAYAYFNVSPEDWNAFRSAPAKGPYLNGTFKAKHRCEKLVGNEWLAQDQQRDARQNEQARVEPVQLERQRG